VDVLARTRSQGLRLAIGYWWVSVSGLRADFLALVVESAGELRDLVVTVGITRTLLGVH
jgi:hypothetical protein